MHRLEAAIERVVERMVLAWEKEQEHEKETNKPKPDEVREAFEVLLVSERFDEDLAAFEDQYPGAFGRLIASRLKEKSR